VYGFAQQDFKVLAEVYAEMLEGKQANEDVLDFLSTELREVGRRPAVYASLQKFLSYLNSPRLDKYARAVLSRNVQDFSENVRFYNQRKRLVDLVVSLFLILFLSPVFLAVAILLWWDTPQPVVRKARYLGLHGKPFNYYMFRTFPSLLQGALSESHLKLADSYPKEVLEQYTNESWVRRGLIRWNLYRLPALLNVLKGEMSLIGPTPLSLHEFPSLSTQQAFSNLPKHLSVRPGAIGKAQLRAYLSPPLTWDEAMEIDRDYLSTLSARSDLQILRQAIRVYLSNTQRNLRDLFHPGRHDWFQRTLTRLADG
jgi:sugar transferase EpsL